MVDAGGAAGQRMVTVLVQTVPSAIVSSDTGAATGMVNVLFGGVMRKVSKAAFVNCNLSARDAYVSGSNNPEVCFVVKPDGKSNLIASQNSKDLEYSSLAVPLPVAGR